MLRLKKTKKIARNAQKKIFFLDINYMKRYSEALFLSELLLFYGFILKAKNIFFEILFFVFLVVLAIVALKIKAVRLYWFAGLAAGMLALTSFYAQTSKLKSLVPLSQAERLYCQLSSSPEKMNDAYYSINVKAVALNSGFVAGSAKGNLKVIIKAQTLQGNLPGKTGKNKDNSENIRHGENSINGYYNALPLDKGLFIFFSGKFAETDENNQEKQKPRNAQPARRAEQSVFLADSFYLGNTEIFAKPYKNKLLEFRAFIRQRLKRIFWSFSKAGKLLAALLIGSKDYLDMSQKLLFQKAGLSHVLALSGLHLSMMCAFAEQTANFFKKKKHHLLLMVLSSSAFVFIAGAQPSLVRALIFICIKCMCSFFNIKCRNSAVFYLSLCVHILLQPAAAFSLQFLLSYSAVYGIFFLSPKILALLAKIFPAKSAECKKNTDNSVEQGLLLSKCKAFFDRLKQLLAVSAGAQLATIPVQLLMLGTFTPVGIISSVLVVPLVSLFVILGVFAVLIVLVLPESLDFFNIILNFMCNIIVVLVQFFSRL